MPDPINGFSSLVAQFQALGAAGVMGALVRAIMAPKERWWRRAQQTVVGVFSAVFLGGLLAEGVLMILNAGIYAYLASGFVCGTAGEAVISWAQRRLLDSRK